MHIATAKIVMAILVWLGNKATAGIWENHKEMEAKRQEAAQYLCDKKDKCDALEAFAMKGLKKKSNSAK